MIKTLPWEYPLRNIMRRPGRTLLTTLCSALAAFLIVATVSFVHGLEGSALGTAPANTAILLSRASEQDLVRSAIAASVPDLVMADVEGIAKVHDTPCVSPEIHMAANLRYAGKTKQGFLRGFTPRALLVHEAVTLVDGKLPGPGEIMVGRLVADRLGLGRGGLSVGDRLGFEDGEFRIAGVFAAPGTTMESEVWVPLHELMGLTSRDDISAVFVRFDDPRDFDYLDLFANRRLDLELLMISAEDYYAEMAAYFVPMRRIAWMMAIMVGLAALFGGANIMNAAVQDRMRELSTLRAVGYPPLALVWALIVEATLHAGVGAVFGLILAQVAFHGGSISLAMQAFELKVGALAIVIGFAGTWALAILGSLPSCWRAARCGISSGLKER